MEGYSSYVIAALIIASTLIWKTTRLSKLPYPPGPKGIPLLGNVYDIPPRREWVTYAKWSREYGERLS